MGVCVTVTVIVGCVCDCVWEVRVCICGGGGPCMRVSSSPRAVTLGHRAGRRLRLPLS